LSSVINSTNVTITMTWTSYPYNDTIYSLTVWTYWVLIIDKRWIQSYYYDRTNRLVIELSASAWAPTVWTIWDWRTYLWWYTDTDNILWSQQANDIWASVPVNTRYTTFWWGNWSWTQAISNWNKWKMVGFLWWDDWLFIFKEDWIYHTSKILVKKTDTNQDWTYDSTEIEAGHQITRITSNWTVNQYCIAEVQKDVFYYDHNNRAVRRLSYERWSFKLEDNAISDEIRPKLLELSESQYLSSTSFKYPLFKLHCSDNTASTIRIWYWNSSDPWVEWWHWIFYIPNRTFVYNVETKWWSEESNKNTTWTHPFLSHKWYFSSEIWDIFKDQEWEVDDWEFNSKAYSFWNTKDLKKFWLVQLFWKIIPTTGYTKTCTVQVIIDWVKVDERVISNTLEQTFALRIDLYDIWRTIQINILHSWKWKLEIYDLWIEAKVSSSYNWEYY
jgi:hypothetical protein